MFTAVIMKTVVFWGVVGVGLVRNDVSEGCVASIFKVQKLALALANDIVPVWVMTSVWYVLTRVSEDRNEVQTWRQ
jgi:hypothetical protein